MSTTSLPINLKGLIVGNACTDPSECYQPGPNGTSLHQYEFLYKHGFYTDLEYDRMRAACVMGYDGSICKRIRQEMDEFFNQTKTPILNIYATCYGVDCDDQLGAVTFFNNPIHRDLLHIRDGAAFRWESCNDPLYQSYKMNANASYWIYPHLLRAGYRVVISFFIAVDLFGRCRCLCSCYWH
jgi:hypothetical protein